MSPTTTQTSIPPAIEERFARILLADITPSRTNPRKHFEEAYLTELARSLADKGLLQPIIVRPVGANGHVEIVAGECRYRAAKQLAWTEIPAIVRPYTDEQVLELQLIENIHRRDLTPLEQARGYRQLIDSNPSKHSAESIAARIGVSPQWVWDRMKLNDLIPEAKKLLDRELITVGHAILIARQTPENQKRILDPDTDANAPLFESEDSLEFDDDDAKVRKDPYFGLKTKSVKELDRWITDHIRFDVAHAAQAQPFEFGETPATLEAAEARSGRGRKVVAITHEYRVSDDARDEKERTYGSEAWERADGKEKSKGNYILDSLVTSP